VHDVEPTKPPTNGWRQGTSRVQQWLRIGTAIIFLGVATVIALDPLRDDLPTILVFVGALLILLGYESIIRFPKIGG
jgi:hypothetical protein